MIPDAWFLIVALYTADLASVGRYGAFATWQDCHAEVASVRARWSEEEWNDEGTQAFCWND